MSWTGTSYSVSRYDGRTIESLTSRDGLPHDSVSALAVTGDGSVWAATKEGLARIAPVAGSLGEPRVVPPPPSDIAIAGVIDARGRPVGGRPVADGAASITVALRSPTFFSEERTLFSERLLPLETDFPPPHSEARIRYPSLAPGSDTLEAQAIVASGIRSLRPVRFHFVVGPPWWGTAGAKGGNAPPFSRGNRRGRASANEEPPLASRGAGGPGRGADEGADESERAARGGAGPDRAAPRERTWASRRRSRSRASDPVDRTCETGVPCPGCLGPSRLFVTATSGSSGRDRSSRAWERGCSGSHRDGSS